MTSHVIALLPLSLCQAVRRIVERDGVSEEDAVRRLRSQWPSAKQIQHANVVLCTLWEPDQTQKQVIRHVIRPFLIHSFIHSFIHSVQSHVIELTHIKIHLTPVDCAQVCWRPQLHRSLPLALEAINFMLVGFVGVMWELEQMLLIWQSRSVILPPGDLVTIFCHSLFHAWLLWFLRSYAS